MDRVSFMRSVISEEVGEDVAQRVIAGKRPSTLKQQQVAWSAFQKWLEDNPNEDISIASFLKFFIFLKDIKNLNPVTVMNYRSYLALPFKIGAEIDLHNWKFKDLEKAFFLETPANRPTLPAWSVDKVLNLLSTPHFASESCSLFNLLRKALFLVALASGNRVSEISAMWLPLHRNLEGIRIPVKPGFIFKNQRAGRAPPEIFIRSLVEGPEELCPVKALEVYLQREGRSRGALFVNSNSKAQLLPATVSHTLCGLIEEGDPGKVPRGHDVRKAATSIAWTRGLKSQDIISRAFWASSSTFIRRYLEPQSAAGVALGTVPN